MRTLAVWLFIAGIGAYAWRDWFKALCGLILLVSVIGHPDMPSSVFGIQGLNPWNLLLLDVVLAWFVQRGNETAVERMPGHVKAMMALFLVIFFAGFLRMIMDLDGMREWAHYLGWSMPGLGGMVSEYLINPLKWVVPGLLLFDGCRSRSRFVLAIAALMGVYLLLAIQVLRWMPLQTALEGGDFAIRSGNRLRKEIGYHRTDLSVMLAGASWALFSTKELFRGRAMTALILAGSLMILLAQLLTAGRGGYLAWSVIGLLYCLVWYRKYLLVVPVVVAGILGFMPGLVDRITTGFSGPQEISLPSSADPIDANELTAGRSVAWPLVVEEILRAPVFGHGREAMKRKGIASVLFLNYQERAPHPHNAYLEILLDNGLVGFLVVVPLFFLVFWYSFVLFRDRTVTEFRVAGGVGVALIGALLVGSLTGQTFYPREVTIGTWCAIGLVLRTYLDRKSQARVASMDPPVSEQDRIMPC